MGGEREGSIMVGGEREGSIMVGGEREGSIMVGEEREGEGKGRKGRGENTRLQQVFQNPDESTYPLSSPGEKSRT